MGNADVVVVTRYRMATGAPRNCGLTELQRGCYATRTGSCRGRRPVSVACAGVRLAAVRSAPDIARMSEVSVVRGSTIIFRVFDVAEELDLRRVESELLASGGSSRLRMARSTRHALVVRDAPITLALGEARIRLGDRTVATELAARVWSYGVVSMQFHLPTASGTPWSALVRQAALIETDHDIDTVAVARVNELAQSLRSAATLPHAPTGMEDYVVHFVEALDGVTGVGELATRADIPALILGEPDITLSRDVTAPILDGTLSYSSTDLAVIDWNSALVVDPGGGRDVVDMIEFAVTHLMEFRHFDTLLDERLGALYDDIERRRRVTAFGRGDYDRLSREASALYLEFSEHVERIENSLKFVGDFFLATVFRRATARFQLREWEESVMRKVNALARLSELLAAEVNVRRSHLLELIIIGLILFEIVQTTVMAMR